MSKIHYRWQKSNGVQSRCKDLNIKAYLDFGRRGRGFRNHPGCCNPQHQHKREHNMKNRSKLQDLFEYNAATGLRDDLHVSMLYNSIPPLLCRFSCHAVTSPHPSLVVCSWDPLRTPFYVPIRWWLTDVLESVSEQQAERLTNLASGDKSAHNEGSIRRCLAPGVGILLLLGCF